jgi:hypothetical protein
MTIDEAKAHKASLERHITEALDRFNTETGLQITALDVISAERIGEPPRYYVTAQVILPAF